MSNDEKGRALMLMIGYKDGTQRHRLHSPAGRMYSHNKANPYLPRTGLKFALDVFKWVCTGNLPFNIECRVWFDKRSYYLLTGQMTFGEALDEIYEKATEYEVIPCQD